MSSSTKKILRGKILRNAKVIFLIMSFVGLLDMFYQAFFQTKCGPIARMLVVFFPHAPGAARCPCEEVSKQLPINTTVSAEAYFTAGMR